MNQAFNLKSSMQPVYLFEIKSYKLSDISEQIDYLNDKTPNLLANAPVVLDLNRVEKTLQKQDLIELIDYLKQQNINPIGAQCHSPSIKKIIIETGLNHSKIEKKQNVDFLSSDIGTRVITQQVRSGQQIYAANENLVILNNVSAGAEVIADGSITIFGALRGRAVAGAKGRENTQIICQNQHAQLISIQGQYMVDEQLPKLGNACRFYIKEDRLEFDELTTS
ncbi:MAG: septum site-determining protein MinC [Saccharospirillaceae bacterium]|nr:septum site-determining protein MinC [Pseudomonadales bacterium]NRB78116.1 septum site-determining protein MinC [Saccharospirillaceae bacterium]